MKAASRVRALVGNVNQLLRALSFGFAIAAFSQGSAGLKAQELSALARLNAQGSSLRDKGVGLALDLALSQPVPYRIHFLDGPPRLIIDFREVDFSGVSAPALDRAARVQTLSWGPFLAGWSRLVAVLDAPLSLTSAEEVRAADGSAVVRLRFAPTTPAAFRARIAAQGDLDAEGDWSLPKAAKVDAPIRRQTGDRPLRVVLDPGHGGIDPGAEAGKITEARLMLTFALELSDLLTRAGLQVELTRRTDVFVPLETRVSVARAAGADVFLSLHADAVTEGEATGATIYRLDEMSSDAASAQLAERHDRADLLAGIDLSGNDDEVAGVLMDLARAETQPRADRLAERLVTAITGAGLKMHRHPIQGAAFSVLKSADIPSLLMETGFLSSEQDRARLLDPVWRAQLQEAILTALQEWTIDDAAEARRIRQ